MDDYDLADGYNETVSSLVEKAEAVAEKMATRMAKAYVASVENDPKSFLVEGIVPDDDDFFAWLEGYDWSEVSNG